MRHTSRFTRVALFVLLAGLLLLAVSIGLASFFTDNAHHGSLMLFDDDMSDSAFAWFVAIPIVVVVVACAMVVAIGAIFLALLAAFIAVALGLFAALFGTLVAVVATLMPIAIILAVPALAIYGFVKLMQRNRQMPVVG